MAEDTDRSLHLRYLKDNHYRYFDIVERCRTFTYDGILHDIHRSMVDDFGNVDHWIDKAKNQGVFYLLEKAAIIQFGNSAKELFESEA